MAVAINEMDVVSDAKSPSGSGGEGSKGSAPTPEVMIKRQIEETMRHAVERARRLEAD